MSSSTRKVAMVSQRSQFWPLTRRAVQSWSVAQISSGVRSFWIMLTIMLPYVSTTFLHWVWSIGKAVQPFSRVARMAASVLLSWKFSEITMRSSHLPASSSLSRCSWVRRWETVTLSSEITNPARTLHNGLESKASALTGARFAAAQTPMALQI